MATKRIGRKGLLSQPKTTDTKTVTAGRHSVDCSDAIVGEHPPSIVDKSLPCDDGEKISDYLFDGACLCLEWHEPENYQVSILSSMTNVKNGFGEPKLVKPAEIDNDNENGESMPIDSPSDDGFLFEAMDWHEDKVYPSPAELDGQAPLPIMRTTVSVRKDLERRRNATGGLKRLLENSMTSGARAYGITDLDDCLNLMMDKELLENMQCYSCNAENTTLTKCLDIARLPDLFVIHLKRFEYDAVHQR